MQTKNITCKEVMDHICDNLGEDLNSPKCVAIKNHLDHCENCQKYFKNIDSTIQLYKKYNVEVDEKMHSRLIDFLGLKDE